LVATLLLTGLATFAVGFVPTYDQVGIWGAVILTIIRFIQGVGVGAEWGIVIHLTRPGSAGF
jgi:MFS family permease